MSTIICMTGRLYEAVLTDLRRPHPYAAERVGFLYAYVDAPELDRYLVLVADYDPVPDDRYIKSADPTVGAEIDTHAIRAAMQRSMDTGAGVLHVHLHGHAGRPQPSRVDMQNLPALMRPFCVVNPIAAHGFVIFSEDDAIAALRLPDDDRLHRDVDVAIVGYPLRIWRSRRRGR